MNAIFPYLNFNGQAEEAFTLYRSVLGGEFTTMQRFGDMPEGPPIPEEDKKKIMHLTLSLGKGMSLMASDALASMNQHITVGNNSYISLDCESEAEVDKIFKGLSEGGKIEMPAQKTFWGAYFAMFSDKFGVQWMLNYDYTDAK